MGETVRRRPEVRTPPDRHLTHYTINRRKLQAFRQKNCANKKGAAGAGAWGVCTPRCLLYPALPRGRQGGCLPALSADPAVCGAGRGSCSLPFPVCPALVQCFCPHPPAPFPGVGRALFERGSGGWGQESFANACPGSISLPRPGGGNHLKRRSSPPPVPPLSLASPSRKEAGTFL